MIIRNVDFPNRENLFKSESWSWFSLYVRLNPAVGWGEAMKNAPEIHWDRLIG